MKYGNIVDGGLVYAPEWVILDDRQINNPPSSILLQLGYLPITETAMPTDAESGYRYRAGWTKLEDRIEQTWTLEKIPESELNTGNLSALQGATPTTDGKAGYAPAPLAGPNTRYLRSDGTWATPPDTHDWSSITGKPDTFTPTEHVHDQYATNQSVDQKFTDLFVKESSFLNFPTVGKENTIYIDTTVNKYYRWDGNDLKYYIVGSNYEDIEIINCNF